MADLWIPAATALALVVGPGKNTYGVCRAICIRAHHGLLAAKCTLFTVGSQRRDNADVPREFWWAEGEAALEQDWSVGDFSTWIDQKVECCAFGVTFALEGLLAMVPPERRGPARLAASVSGASDWISAIEALRLVQERTGLSGQEAIGRLAQKARLGFAPARAVLMSATSMPGGKNATQREWDIPDDFWAAPGPDAHWESGDFRAYNVPPESRPILAEGVHFALPALDAIFPPDSRQLTVVQTVSPLDTKGGQKGRPPAAYWDELWCAVWGDIYRGDLQPKTQADVQNAMLDWLVTHGHNAGESTVKPRARLLFQELTREGGKSLPK